MISPASRLFLLLLSIALLGACAQQIGDIDRTNPNKLRKAAFDGEWYVQQTVVGVNATAISSFIGLEGQTERIVWDFEEDYLIGYRTHEDYFGVDQAGLGEGETFDRGRPVLAFGIQSHFDVQRGYSSSTGEETNVISENTSDRDWNERDWVRLNWTANQVNNGSDSMVYLADGSDLNITPQDGTTEPTWFVERDETGDVVYIDVVNTYLIEPDYTECALTFGVPLWGSACGPETIEVRTSMVKITDDSDYQAREYGDYEMNDFGWFQTHRPTWDERYGARNSGRIHLANRFNIWQNHTDANGDVLPYEQRTPRALVYYMNEDFPESLKQTMFDIALDYDSALRRIVATYQGVDVPTDPAAMADVPYSDVPQMFYMCDNPGGTDGPWAASNAAYESGHCVRGGEVKNIGDIRYSFAVWINHEQLDGPLGYGPSSLDVTSGEILSGRAYIYGGAMNTISQYALDLAKIISGETDLEEYAYGRTIEDYFANLRESADDDLFRGLLADRSARADQVRSAVDNHLAQPRTEFLLSQPPEAYRLRSVGEVHPLRRLRGTELEQLALFPEVADRMSALGSNPFDAPTGGVDQLIDTMSLTNLGDPIAMADDLNQRLDSFFRHGPDADCVMMAEVIDPSLIGMAEELAEERHELFAEGWSTNEVDVHQWDTIRNRLLRFVMAHEIGHNFGMMHNFSGSYDALNYHNEYWELREKTFDRCDENAVTFSNLGFFSGDIAPPSCEGGESVEDYAERSADLMQELLEENIHSYQFSSVMDYTPRYYNNEPGLGHYDFAALAYVYGDLRTVFNSTPHQLRVNVNYNAQTDDFASSSVTRSDNPIITFEDVDEFLISRRNQTPADSPWYDPEENDQGVEHAYDWYHYSMLPIMFGGDIEAMYDRRLVPASQAGGEVLVPFRFCSDYYRGSRTECNVFDQGADFLEIFQDVYDTWEGGYYLSFFRRDRAGFGLWLYPTITRIYNYTMLPMTRLYQHWLIRAAGRGVAWYSSEWGGDDATQAAFAAIDFLGNVITKPSIGRYYFDETEGMYMNISDELDYRAPFHVEIEEGIEGEGDYLTLSGDIGRYGFDQYARNEFNQLGHWGFIQPEILSWFWAKWAAMMALVVPTVDVIGQDTSSDSTAFSIPIYLIFPDQMTSFFGALPGENFDVIGNCVVMDDDGKADTVVQRNLISDPPEACEGDDAVTLNPYTAAYGNADFNMRLLSMLYGSAYFQSNYDMSWFDRSNVYIHGRGHTPVPADGFHFVQYEDDGGLIFSALMPDELDEDEEPTTWVGNELINRANELQSMRDAELEANDGEFTDEYYEYNGERGNLVESMRLLNQANEIFEGYNVFLPMTL